MAFLLAGASTSAGAWTFDDEECSPETDHALVASIPNLYLMLDRSQSMNEGSPRKWTQAKEGLTALLDESIAATDGTDGRPIAHFGFGLFSNTVSHRVDCDLGTEVSIKNEISAANASGTTATAAAIKAGYGRAACFDGTPAALVLVNDGAPTVPNTSPTCNYNDSLCQRRSALNAFQETCDNRHKAPMFVVGLGDGTDVQLNDFLAAAGNTGECSFNGAEADPCLPEHRSTFTQSNWNTTLNNWTCSGSIQVDNKEELIVALQNITNRLQCTFPIDFLNSNIDSVPVDPDNDYEYLAVRLYEGVNPIDIYHEDSSMASPAGEGWRFTSEARQFVEFSDYYCNNIQEAKYARATTQLACMCQQELGAPCEVPNAADLNVCPDGVWACEEGTDVCVPETGCCIQGEACDTGLEGRCRAGQMDCTTLPGECVSIHRGMPEVCNGLDDNCDGKIDNISEYWDHPDNAALRGQLLADRGDLHEACNFADVCMCPEGPAEDADADTIAEFLNAWGPHCLCGEALAPMQSEGPAHTFPDSEPTPRSGCQVAAGAPGAAVLLFAFGLLGLRRRR